MLRVGGCDWKRDKRAGAVCNGRGARKAYARDGYRVSRVGSADEGIDFVLTSSDARDVVRCSRAGGTVDAAAVREFYGAMLYVRARHGFIVTTRRFSASAQGATANIPITLIDGQTLLS